VTAQNFKLHSFLYVSAEVSDCVTDLFCLFISNKTFAFAHKFLLGCVFLKEPNNTRDLFEINCYGTLNVLPPIHNKCW
jgi:hypothetical protein